MTRKKKLTEEEVLKKWKTLIDAAKAYWVDSVPTGMLDREFDEAEERAKVEDKFNVRNYIIKTYFKGVRIQNAPYIKKIKKTKVPEGQSMYTALCDIEKSLGPNLFYNLKYDGSSLAIYIDSSTGIPKTVVTVGNINLESDENKEKKKLRGEGEGGIDQTWKLKPHHLPKIFPKGIKAVQAEALIDLERFSGDLDKARQKANGLINSSTEDALSEVYSLLTLRVFRYFLDLDTPEGVELSKKSYREVMEMIPTVLSKEDGHIMFCPAFALTAQELSEEYCKTDQTKTPTGTFLNDGWVVYSPFGECLGAVKYPEAGKGEIFTSTVRSIQWNDQFGKGKDSWSANVIIDPINIKGSVITKPSAGSVGKLLRQHIVPGAVVRIILANSTIPMVGETLQFVSPELENYMWPTCSCGYVMSPADIYGSNLKCGNRYCSVRLGRMEAYVRGLSNNFQELDLNKLLVIDRFKWETTNVDLSKLYELVVNKDHEGYYNYLSGFLGTELLVRNFNLVWETSFKVLCDEFCKK